MAKFEFDSQNGIKSYGHMCIDVFEQIIPTSNANGRPPAIVVWGGWHGFIAVTKSCRTFQRLLSWMCLRCAYQYKLCLAKWYTAHPQLSYHEKVIRTSLCQRCHMDMIACNCLYCQSLEVRNHERFNNEEWVLLSVQWDPIRKLFCPCEALNHQNSPRCLWIKKSARETIHAACATFVDMSAFIYEKNCHLHVGPVCIVSKSMYASQSFLFWVCFCGLHLNCVSVFVCGSCLELCGLRVFEVWCLGLSVLCVLSVLGDLNLFVWLDLRLCLWQAQVVLESVIFSIHAKNTVEPTHFPRCTGCISIRGHCR